MSQITAQKPETIRKMFGEIAPVYDRVNSVLSLGIHSHWKRALVRASQVKSGARVLDCATGTGDLAFEFERQLHGTGEVIGTDVSEPMLEVAQSKAKSTRSSVRFEKADAMALPYPDGKFDVASISFGIRNTASPFQALKEMARVVRPGGQILVLEFGQPRSALVRGAFQLYSDWVLPRVGGWISGRPEAYRYLKTSSAAFPCGQRFLEMARLTGVFSNVQCRAFQGGIAYLYQLEVKS